MRTTRLVLFLALSTLVLPLRSLAQEDDLLSLLGEEEVTDYTTASFKTNRVVNLHSLENTHAGVLDFKINHRFGQLNQGVYDLFGLDNASIRLGLDYGVTSRLQVGMGRSTYQKMLDGYLKYRILRQSTGKVNMPVSLTAMGGMYVNTLKWANPDRENYFTSRLSYAWQLILGRKFNDWITVQLSPTLIHRNLVPTASIANDVYALGIGVRQRITRRVTLNAEYTWVMPDQLDPRFTNALSVGLDIETGGHVFQLHLTNATWMTEPGFITETTGDWRDGGIHFGFNISRVFTIVKPKI
jgi:opacity protein-like surface antigen